MSPRHPLILSLFALSLLACDAEQGSAAQTDAPPDGADPEAAPSEGDAAEAGLAEDEAEDTELPVAPGPAPQVVQTSGGSVRGLDGQGYVGFVGVPYGEPPVGALRFAPPQPASWEGELDVSERPGLGSNRCPQRLPVVGDSLDEDCLRLNIHVPDPLTPNTPVLLWVHGGGFTVGEGLQAGGGTSGHVLAADGDVVVVSMNYRLGALGWLSHPDLDGADGASGNLGYLDLLLAMRWVQDNIAAFGGDPDRVAVAGSSAGGLMVCMLLADPEADGLYSRAVVQSLSCTMKRGVQDGHAQGQAYAATLGCGDAEDVAACMRAVPIEEIVEQHFGAGGTLGAQSWGPVIDGARVAAALPGALAAPARESSVPVMLGFTADEGNTGPLLGNFTAVEDTDEAYAEAMRAALIARGADPDNLDMAPVLAAYPREDFVGLYDNPDQDIEIGAAAWGLVSMGGDLANVCPSRDSLAILTAARPTYAYQFSYPDGTFPLKGRGYGAFHSAELQYLFGIHPEVLFNGSFTEEERALHGHMRDYWVRFATSGSPAPAQDKIADGVVDWPRYLAPGEKDASAAEDSDLFMDLDREISVLAGVKRERCEVLYTALGR